MPSFNSGNKETTGTAKPAAPAKKQVSEIVAEVLAGKWGTGDDRKKRLEAAGYDYDLIQRAVERASGKTETLTSVKPAASTEPAAASAKPAAKNLDEVAADVIRGKYGNGTERKQKLEAAGFNYDEVQAAVNAKLSGKTSAQDLDTVAKDVIRGAYGNGAERKQRLEAAGYDYNAVQARVNQLLK